jgi:hypothetical protein
MFSPGRLKAGNMRQMGTFGFRNRLYPAAVRTTLLPGVALTMSCPAVFAQQAAKPEAFHTAWGISDTVLAKGFAEPCGLLLAPSGDLQVAETGAGRILKLVGNF